MEKLKRCPFCGSQAEFYGDGRGAGISVCCPNDDCIINGSYSFKGDDQIEKATEMWNKRILSD